MSKSQLKRYRSQGMSLAKWVDEYFKTNYILERLGLDAKTQIEFDYIADFISREEYEALMARLNEK